MKPRGTSSVGRQKGSNYRSNQCTVSSLYLTADNIFIEAFYTELHWFVLCWNMSQSISHKFSDKWKPLYCKIILNGQLNCYILAERFCLYEGGVCSLNDRVRKSMFNQKQNCSFYQGIIVGACTVHSWKQIGDIFFFLTNIIGFEKSKLQHKASCRHVLNYLTLYSLLNFQHYSSSIHYSLPCGLGHLPVDFLAPSWQAPQPLFYMVPLQVCPLAVPLILIWLHLTCHTILIQTI